MSHISPNARVFAPFLDAHLDHLEIKHYSTETLKVRRIRLAMFARWCETQNVFNPAEITRTVVEQYQGYLFHYRKRNGQPLALATQRSRLMSVGVWLKWIARQGIIPHNPIAEIELPRPGVRLPQYLTSEEAERVLCHPRVTTPVGLRDRALFTSASSKPRPCVSAFACSSIVEILANRMNRECITCVISEPRCGNAGRKSGLQ